MDFHAEDEMDTSWVCCLLEDIPSVCCDGFSLGTDNQLPSFFADHPPCSSSLSVSSRDSHGASDGQEECCRKRSRNGSSCAYSTKACREKLRRDHLNERFLELSCVLELGKTLKLDKAAILTHAMQMVKMLQEESGRLENQKVGLKQKINDLKAEKKELRAEKHNLKSKKEDMEQKIKALGAPPSLQLCSTGANPSKYLIPSLAVGGKFMPFFHYPGVPLWQVMPCSAVDTSQDQLLYSPGA